jgi:hypothetical protein
MIHEMLHAWLYVTDQNIAHDSVAWYFAVARLSLKVLGHYVNQRHGGQRKSVRVKLDDGSSVVRKVPVRDAVPHIKIACWPYSLRPGDYDLGEAINCPTY